jgi:hypothetical protein
MRSEGIMVAVKSLIFKASAADSFSAEQEYNNTMQINRTLKFLENLIIAKFVRILIIRNANI